MIPILFDKTAATFTTNGIGRLTDCISARVHEERNGAFDLTIEMPVNGIHVDDIELGSIIMAKPSPKRSSQPFEVDSIIKHMGSMTVEIHASHLSYRLNKIPVMPFTAYSAASAMAGLKTNSAEPNPFTFTTDKTLTVTYKQTLPSSCRNRLLGEQGSILQTYRGEYLFDAWTVRLLAARGLDNGVEIRYGKNLTSLDQDNNIENTITGILPFWTGMAGEKETVMWLPEIVLYSDNADLYPYKRTAVIDFSGEFSEKPTEAQLRAVGKKYIEDNGIGTPVVSLDVSAVTLAQTTDYQSTKMAEEVDLCDIVTVIFPQFGASTKAKITEIDFDVLRERLINFHVGDTRNTLAQTIAGTTTQIEQSQTDQQTWMMQALAQATAVINGDLTGASVTTQTDVNGNPVGLVFMDTTDPATAKNCIRINSNGIGFSTNGPSGPYTSAWTIDGTLDMSQINVINIDAGSITVGTMSFDRIKGGTAILGGLNNGNGALYVYDSNLNLIGRLSNTGLYAKTGTIGPFKVLETSFQMGNYVNDDYAGAMLFSDYGIQLKTIRNISGYDYLSRAELTGSRLIWYAVYMPGIGSWDRSRYVYIQRNNNLAEVVYNDSDGYNRTYMNGLATIMQKSLSISGDLTVGGTKNRKVNAGEYGDRLLYAYETASPFFGDIGEGQIAEDGLAYIVIDPALAGTITTDSYQVFIQAYGSGGIYVKERHPDHFVVAGDPGERFAWELKAKQADYDQARLDPAAEKFTVPQGLYGESAACHLQDIYEERVLS